MPSILTFAYLRKTLLALGLLAMTACGNDPVTPTDETKNKLHGDPVTARLTFESVAYDSTTHTYTRQVFGVSPAKQVVNFAIREGEWKPDNVQPLSMLAYRDELPVSYLLHIDYFDAHGQSMNYQFIENGQDMIHQHFFMAEAVAIAGLARPDLRRTNKLYRYTYLDTTPFAHEPGSTHTMITGNTNPIGFRGLLQFTQPKATLSLNIWLLHALNTQRGKYLDDTHTITAPYYRFTPSQAAGGVWDIKMPVDLIIH